MKKINNKILLTLLVLLVAVFVLTKVFRSPALESNLDVGLFAIDTALIRSVKVQRPDQPAIILQRNNSAWTITEGERHTRVQVTAINSFLRTLSQIKPERVVSRKEDKWRTYQVDDSTSIHLTAFDQDSVPVVDWYIGKESAGVTYIRPADDEAVYAMEGSIRSRADDGFNDWRDKTFIRITPSSVTKVMFQYPSDTGFVLQRRDNTWMIDDDQADSVQVQRYLSKLQSRNLSSFADEFTPSHDADVTISVEATNGSTTVVKGWKGDDDEWTLNSTVQQDVYFKDARIDDDLFTGKQTLLKRE